MMMYPTQYDVDAKQDEYLRRAAQERLANEAQAGSKHVSFRRAVELLVGAISALDSQPRQQPEAEPIPAKLATDSGIYRIR